MVLGRVLQTRTTKQKKHTNPQLRKDDLTNKHKTTPPQFNTEEAETVSTMSQNPTQKGAPASKNDSLVDCLSDEYMDLPPSLRGDGAFCRLLPHVLTRTECQAVIDRAERKGFEPALLNIGGGRQVYAPDTRNSDRVIFDDTAFAERLFGRIRHLLPSHYGPHSMVGLNERMRILRYGPGHDFKPHCDGSFARDDSTSLWTLMLYLNDGFDGGSTRFHPDMTTVIPKAGSVLVFYHGLCHEGEQVRAGTKYAIRTDVMFRLKDETN